MRKIFPELKSENLIISATGQGASTAFSVLISNQVMDLECISKGQCFPLYLGFVAQRFEMQSAPN
jgi:predicted helicase